MSITKAELKRVKSLGTKKGRKTTGLFAAEGVRLMEESLRHGFLPEKVYTAMSGLSGRGAGLVEALKATGTVCIDVSAREITAMTSAETSQGILGLFRKPPDNLSELYRPKFRRILWCQNISDPGNFGTLLRSALAFGFEMVIASGATAEIFAPKVVRASMGSLFGLTIAKADTNEVFELAEKNTYTVVATGAGGKKYDNSLKKVFERNKLILAIGGEAEGLTPDVVQKADLRVAIDHSGKVESLNAGVAGSILMEKIYRSREERL